MTSPFVLAVHKDFAVKMKESGCDQHAIASHLREVLLEDDEILQIVQELNVRPEQSDKRLDFS